MLFIPGVGSGVQPGHKLEFGSRFLLSALGADPHFSYDPSTDRWHATVHTALGQPLHHSVFVVIDLETTGLKPGLAAITEVAAVRVENGRLGTEFHTLVNPGRRVPAAITRLTGITEAMLRDPISSAILLCGISFNSIRAARFSCGAPVISMG